MRSKRKEVNKYAFRAVLHPQEEQEDQIHRATGIKPFQLVKIRQGQRSTLDLAHSNNEILHRRGASNNLYSDEKEVYMDLIIKQKLIVDAQVNQKLQSQRKNIVSLGRTEQDEVSQEEREENGELQGSEVQIYSETNDAYCLQSSHQPQNETQNVEEIPQQQKRKRSKCHCCLQINNATHAIIRHKNEANNVLCNGQTQQRQPTTQQAKLAEQATVRELKAMKQKALPPFSFTNIKWRSKSEILQVDKWKQRYGKDIHLTQKVAIIEKTASSSKYDSKAKGKEMPVYKSMEEQRMALPILHKSKELESKPKIFKWSPVKREEREVIRIFNPQGDSKNKYLIMSNQLRRDKDGRKKPEEEKVEIAIKKMYETQENVEHPPSSQKRQDPIIQQQAQAPPEKQKPKRKKSKFPQIQISTFYSTKDEAIQRKRLRIESMQRLAREWRFNPPKKVYLQKVMEEIPERWQYGESRESSREVDHYLRHQEEQARRDQEEAERRLEEQLQMMAAEQDYLCNAEVGTPLRP